MEYRSNAEKICYDRSTCRMYGSGDTIWIIQIIQIIQIVNLSALNDLDHAVDIGDLSDVVQYRAARYVRPLSLATMNTLPPYQFTPSKDIRGRQFRVSSVTPSQLQELPH